MGRRTRWVAASLAAAMLGCLSTTVAPASARRAPAGTGAPALAALLARPHDAPGFPNAEATHTADAFLCGRRLRVASRSLDNARGDGAPTARVASAAAILGTDSDAHCALADDARHGLALPGLEPRGAFHGPVSHLKLHIGDELWVTANPSPVGGSITLLWRRGDAIGGIDARGLRTGALTFVELARVATDAARAQDRRMKRLLGVAPPPPPPLPPGACPGVELQHGHVHLIRPPHDRARLGQDGLGLAYDVHVTGESCAAAEAQLHTVLGDHDETIGLDRADYPRLRSKSGKVGDTKVHTVTASGNGAHSPQLRYSRFGSAPAVDPTVLRPGQTLYIVTRRDAKGLPVGDTCTVGYPLVLTGLIVGTTAGHCGDEKPLSDGIPTFTLGRALPGKRFPFTPLGQVFANPHTSGSHGPDAQGYTLGPKITRVSQMIYRGQGERPLPVVGEEDNDDQHKGDKVCFSAATSGADQCGTITKTPLQADSDERCATFKTRRGDSGGPVYTAPNADGEVRAVGMIKDEERGLSLHGIYHRGCWVTIDHVLSGIDDARLPASPLVAGTISGRR